MKDLLPYLKFNHFLIMVHQFGFEIDAYGWFVIRITDGAFHEILK